MVSGIPPVGITQNEGFLSCDRVLIGVLFLFCLVLFHFYVSVFFCFVFYSRSYNFCVIDTCTVQTAR
jgi:hypothetical protein